MSRAILGHLRYERERQGWENDDDDPHDLYLSGRASMRFENGKLRYDRSITVFPGEPSRAPSSGFLKRLRR